jgi:hypothetical protein
VRWPNDYGCVCGELRQEAAGIREALFDLALCMSKKRTDLPGFGRIKVTGPEMVYKVPVPSVGGDSSGTRMWLHEITVGLKACHFVSDRCGRDIQLRQI